MSSDEYLPLRELEAVDCFIPSSTIRPDNDANKRIYGEKISAKDIVIAHETPVFPRPFFSLALYDPWRREGNMVLGEIIVYAGTNFSEPKGSTKEHSRLTKK